MKLFRRIAVVALILAGVYIIGQAASTYGQGKKEDDPKAVETKKPKVGLGGSKVKWNEKKIAFEMRDKPWSSVFSWFADQAQMPYSSSYTPTGSLTFVNPRVYKDEKDKIGTPRTYTLIEIYDIINEILQGQHKYTMLRGDNVLTLVPADEDIPDFLVPRIHPDELPDRARTEIVEINIEPKGVNVDEFAPELVRLLRPFGKVSPLIGTNRLIIRASVSSLIRNWDVIMPDAPSQSSTLVHKATYVRASTLEGQILKSLGAATVVEIKGAAPATPPDGGPGPKFGPQGSTSRRVRPHTVTSDDSTNTVTVHGPPDKIEQAKHIITNLDKPKNPGDKGLLVGPHEIKYHDVRAGNADFLAKTLTADIFKTNITIRISAAGPSKLFVYADPQTHYEINKIINDTTLPEPESVMIPLMRLDAVLFAEQMKEMFPKDSVPYIGADRDNNSLRIRGTKDQIKEARSIIKSFDDDGAALGGHVRSISLDKASAVTLAEAIKMLFPDIRPNELKVIVPRSGPLDSLAPKEEPKNFLPPVKVAPKQKPGLNPMTEPQSRIFLKKDYTTSLDLHKLREVPTASGAGQAGEQKPGPDAKKYPPVTIAAFGNRLVITSEDPEAIAAVQGLIRLLLNTEAGPGDFEVVRLKYANAVEVAKLLDEAFNGPKQGGGGGKGPPGGGGGGMNIPGLAGMMLGGLTGGGGGGRVEIIRVVADPTTNSMLVKAKPLDMLTIRNLLRNHIDRRDVDNELVPQTYVMDPLKYASAQDIADIVRQLYAESMAPVRAIQQTQNAPGFMFGGSSGQVGSNQRQAILHIGVDGANRLVVNAPKALYEEIKELVKQLDVEDARSEVRVVSSKGIDPTMLARAMDALNPKSTLQRQTNPNLQVNTPNFSGFTGNSGFRGTGGSGFSGGGGPTFIVPGGGGGGIPSFSMPGGGGGGMPTFSPGGGGIRGGGGGGIPSGGGGKGPRGRNDNRGPDFFVSRVTDDPDATVFYDPAEEQEGPGFDGYLKSVWQPSDYQSPNRFVFTALAQKIPYQPEPGPKKGFEKKIPATKGFPDGPIDAPRLPFEIIPLPELDQFIVRAKNAEDLRKALALIELLRTKAEPVQVKMKMVPVRYGDPFNIVNELSQFLSRLNYGVNVITIVPPRGGAQPTPTPAPAPTPTPAQPTPTQPTAVAAGGATNVILIPLYRQSAIMVAAPTEQRMEDIEKLIHDFDQPYSDPAKAVAFPLRRASAIRVAAALNTFVLQRFPAPDNINQIRITWDDGSNTVFVQASPADMAELRSLIDHIDNHQSNGSKNELRVVKLKNAVATDMAFLLQVSIANNTLTLPQPPIPGTQQPVAALGTLQATYGVQAPLTKDITLQWFRPTKDGKKIESGILHDIRISPDARTNALVVSAPEATMPVLMALIDELDSVPIAKSHITVFNLKKIDALKTAAMLQQLFVGSGLGTAPAAPAPAAGGGAQGIRPLTMTITGQTPDGAPIIDLRITVDQRTNSLIVAGSRNDVDVVEALIAKIEDADVPQRQSTAIRLRNSQALDVANALNDFVTKINAIYTTNGDGTLFHMIDRAVAVTAEPISNSILINATPEYFSKLVQIVSQLDTTPPQVVIQVLVAEITMNGSEEFGVEIGLQQPLVFQRGIPSALGTAFNGVAYQTLNPGYNFNDPTQPGTGFLAAQNALLSPNTLGIQGLNNLGVGRISPSSGIGGFVFSAASDSVSVLIRALKIQGRLAVLSRPQVMTLDKQVAYINVGKNIPIISGFTTNATTGVQTPNVDRVDTGVIMQVTPQITPDGRVLMRILPEVSSIGEQIPFGNGFSAPAINKQHLETTVAANDGETIMLGGLITKIETKVENKIPLLGDLPGIGAAFRFRNYRIAKTELIIILTPHIVRNKNEAEQILCDETRRINWATGDVIHMHGNSRGPLPFMGPVPFTPPAPQLFPEPQAKTQAFRVYPPNQPEVRPQGMPLEAFPAPLPGKAPRTNLLQSVFGKRGEVSMEPLPMGTPVHAPKHGYTTKVQYGPAPVTLPALPEVFAPGTPNDLPTTPAILYRPEQAPPQPLPPLPHDGPSLNGIGQGPGSR